MHEKELTPGNGRPKLYRNVEITAQRTPIAVQRIERADLAPHRQDATTSTSSVLCP